ncbi:hypothetical protein RHSIM_Rhsim09G0199000 [Rhododendron simsii]|uniref:DUF7733 domain-containing protein n=1 Tax=Rhododendron simsii TaxID=118357 RepID=A0A834GE41_RHOSS|nr:hypothetical protein RHSIM_Rhsim09G0199000 [Rhododendron simsii]
MSGGVGPISDIRLPKEEEEEVEHKQHEDFTTLLSKKQSTANAAVRGGGGYFTFRQLNALAPAVVLAASGMVGVEDFAFVLFSLVYIHLISRIAFPILSPNAESPVFASNNKILGIYVSVGALVGLFLPIVYILEGIFEGDKEGIKAAAPHVFLLASQVFMEGLTFSGRFSIPVRAFVPVFYNSRRLFTIAEWLRAEISKVDEQHSGGEWRLYVGRGLAIANLAFWSFNLFGFLLPVYLPKAFKKYYSEGYKGKE